MKISKIKIGMYDDPSSIKNKIKIKPQNNKNPADDLYDNKEGYE